jgi:hypothetical protein
MSSMLAHTIIYTFKGLQWKQSALSVVANALFFWWGTSDTKRKIKLPNSDAF